MKLSFNELQEAIISTFYTEIPELVDCRYAPAEHFLGVPARIGMSRPSALIGMVKAERSEINAGFQLSFDTHWIATIISDTSEATKEFNEARNLATKVALTVEKNCFGVDGVYPANVQSFSLANLDPELESGACVWEVEWIQTVGIDELKPEPDIKDLLL